MAIILRRRCLGKASVNGIAAASEQGIGVVRNWVQNDWPNGPIDFVIRWGCTSNTPEGIRQKVLNTAESIRWCANKAQGRIDMQAAGVPVPFTTLYDPYWFEGNEFLELTQKERDIVWIARPTNHHQGRNLFVGSFNDCQAMCGRWGEGYISLLINKVAEYRVLVIQGRVAWVAQKTPGNPEDVAWNVAQGGRFDNVRWGNWPLRVVKAAMQAAIVSGTDFCGVDVMEDAKGNPYVLECNSAPSQTSPYRQQCMAKVFDYIISRGDKKHFPSIDSGEGDLTWQEAIHPAVSSS